MISAFKNASTYLSSTRQITRITRYVDQVAFRVYLIVDLLNILRLF